MREARLASIASVRSKIERGELIPATDLQARLDVTAEWISSAVIEQRLFAICDEAGHDYYPAFYADSRYDRRQLEQVAQRLKSIPPTVKYHFFFAEAHSLYGQTPLEALAGDQLNAVLRAASMCAER